MAPGVVDDPDESDDPVAAVDSELEPLGDDLTPVVTFTPDEDVEDDDLGTRQDRC